MAEITTPISTELHTSKLTKCRDGLQDPSMILLPGRLRGRRQATFSRSRRFGDARFFDRLQQYNACILIH